MNKSFIIFSESWWARNGTTLADGATDEIMIASAVHESLPERDDDIRGEFVIRWYDLAGKAAASLEIFQDSWQYFTAWPDLFKELAQLTNTDITPKQLAEWLTQRGFIDATPREDPYIKP